MKNNYGKKGMEIDFFHNGVALVPFGSVEISTFVEQKRFEHDTEWVKEKIIYCYERKINISMHPRANYYPKQLAKIAKHDQYNISFDTIEGIVYGLDKKGLIDHLDRGHGKSSGSTFVLKGYK